MSSEHDGLKLLPKGTDLSFDEFKLKAFLRIDPDITRDSESDYFSEIINALEAIGIKNINKDTAAELLNKVERDRSVIVAEGAPPKPGQEGQIQYHFDTNRQRIGMDDRRLGRVDHRELNLIQNVKEGETLATAPRRYLPRPANRPRSGSDAAYESSMMD